MSFSPLGLTPLIGVFDMPRALAFYRDVLGLRRSVRVTHLYLSEVTQGRNSIGRGRDI